MCWKHSSATYIDLSSVFPPMVVGIVPVIAEVCISIDSSSGQKGKSSKRGPVIDVADATDMALSPDRDFIASIGISPVRASSDK